MSLKAVKHKSKTMLSRLGGVSAFGFGVSFRPPEADRTVVRELHTFLEDRRALYVAAIWEQPEYVLQSVDKIRAELTNAIKRAGENSPAAAACRLMRAACREFMSHATTMELRNMDRRFIEGWQGETFLLALGALRATFGQQIALLTHLYDVELEEHLASLLPPIPDDDGKQAI